MEGNAQTQPASIQITPSAITLSAGQTQQLAAQSGSTLNLGEGASVAAGGNHTCALLSDRTVKCWGLNSSGQLGNGTTIDSSTPLVVSGLSGVKSIAVGIDHTCALLSDGTVKCWGSRYGNALTTDSSTPVAVSGLSGVTAITAGTKLTCALLSGGTVNCWGGNTWGQLGNGTTSDSNTPVAVSGLSGAIAITAAPGSVHACALVSDGTVRCWGFNLLGQLGNGTTTDSSTPVAVTGAGGVGMLTGVTAIGAGGNHTCVLLSDGTVKCWGMNSSGQLGNGTTMDSSTSVAVSGVSGAMAITSGARHTCALFFDGTSKCWGLNQVGQLGNGSTADSSTPMVVTSLTGGTAIAAGGDHTCALLSGGMVNCWGYNAQGQLGDGTVADSVTPVTVTGGIALPGRGASQVAVAGTNACTLLSNGSVNCWGANGVGQLGDGTTTDSTTPVAVSGLSGTVGIAGNASRICALLSDGTVKCWGYNLFGQLGNGTTINSSTPVAVNGLGNVTAIAAGIYHTCALIADGTVRCWGYNYIGQLGDGTRANSSSPVVVSGLSGVTAIAAGIYHTCALLVDGTVRCWGDNQSDQMGNGTTTNSAIIVAPGAVSGLSGAIAIAAGAFHTCALLSDGTVKCWGDGANGQLGNGTVAYASTPVEVSGLTKAAAIVAGTYNTCALISDGTLKCWGYNYWGNLGNGSTTDSSTPVAVLGLKGATAIAAEGASTCALISDGTVECWGHNANGELGNGTTTDSTTPVAVTPLVPSLVWSSATTSVATIDSASGLATALAPGSSTITATYGALNAQSTLTVANPNSAPTATNVNITGTPVVGQVLTGHYTYNDVDGDVEGASTFRWLRDGVAINGATTTTYTTVSADVGHTLTFEVTPVAVTGTSPGIAATSAGVTIYQFQMVPSGTGTTNAGSVNACPSGQTSPAPCSAAFALNYTVNTDTTFGSTVNVVTQGAPNLDFTLGSTTCSGTVTAGNSCTVNVSFAPRAPGLRMGAVQLMDSSGNLLVTSFIYGVGQGPAIAFGPAIQNTLGTGLSQPYSVAVDGAGDVFIADSYNNRVVEVPAGGGAQTTVGTGLSSPLGVAVDGAGNIFIADIGNNRVVEVPAGGGQQTTVGAGLSSPAGVAVDGAGDVFIADYGNSRVVEVPAGGGAQTTVGSGLSIPIGVAVDGAGDVFIGDYGNSRVVEVSAGGGAQTTVGTGLNNPRGVAVDGAGDVFIADSYNHRVVEVPAGGGAQTTVGNGLRYPYGVAVDGAGNVIIGDSGNNRVLEVLRSQPPTMSFAATTVGITSTDSPQSVTVQNIGNQPLTAVAPGLSLGLNSFAQVGGSGTPADCTSGFSLAPGASCNLRISFTPQTIGSILSAATLTDNAAGSPESIPLSGTGLPPVLQTITVSPAAPTILAGGTLPFTATGNYNNGSTQDLTSTVTWTSSSPLVASINSSGNANGLLGGITTIMASFNSVSGTATLTVDQAPAITSAGSTTFTVGNSGSFSITSFGFPMPTLGESGTLPIGLGFVDNGNGTGTLSGTVAADTVGTYNISFAASNGVSPASVQNFTLKVNGLAAVSAGLSSWWPGNGNFSDASGGNAAINAGGVTFVPGQIGQAFHFDGSPTSHMTLPNAATFAPASNQVTIGAWIRPDFTASNQLDTIFSKRDGCTGGSGTRSYLLTVTKAGLIPNGYSLGSIVWSASDPNDDVVPTTVVPNDGQFHLVIGTYDGAMMTVYLDGVLIAQKAHTGPIPVTSDVPYIGQQSSCANLTNADIDEIQFYSRALSQTEISEIYYGRSAPIGWWPGNGNFSDVSGGNDATNAGGATFVPGEIGQAFHFDGSATSYMTLPNAATFAPASNQVTIGAWIRPDFSVSNTIDTIISKRNGCTGDLKTRSYILSVTKGNLVPNGYSLGSIVWSVSDPNDDAVSKSVVPNDGQFHLVVGTYDGAMMNIYIDGVLVGQKAHTGPIQVTTDMPYIGRQSDCGHLTNADIDEIQFYDRALSPTEIVNLLHAGNAPSIISASSTTMVAGTPGSFSVLAIGNPIPALSESGTVPNGLSFVDNGNGTGTLSGTPTAGGTFNFNFVATNGGGIATQSFTQTMNQAPSITSAASTTFTAGASGSFLLTATGYPAPTFSVTGTTLLPSGVTLSSTGVLSGTPAANTGGTYPIMITANNGITPNDTQNFTLSVNQAPAITSAGTTMFTVGAAGSFTVTLTGFPNPTLSETGTLPSGVTFNSATHVLSGTPAAGTNGTFNITFTASNVVGSSPPQNFALIVSLPSVASLALNPTSVPGGITNSTGTVTLNAPAVGTTAQRTVTLSSANTAAATVPASVTVAAGATSASFTVTSHTVATTTTANISATLNGGTASQSLTVAPPPAVVSLALNPTSVLGGAANSVATVTLSASAAGTAAQRTVTLSSSNTSAATVPASVTVTAGATTATFTVTSHVISAPASPVITATLNASATAALTVNALSIVSVTLNPTSVPGGATNSTGTVTLSAPAVGTAAQRTVTLASDNTTAATVPASVAVATGATTANFTVTSHTVTTSANANISGTFNGGTKSTPLAVTPLAGVALLALNPNNVVGGSGNSTSTITLNAPAAGTAAQRTVTLLSSNTAAATVPASVVVTAGVTTATFTVTSHIVTAVANPVITATMNGSATAPLTVSPLWVLSVALNPTSVKGGTTNSTATITLNAAAAGTAAQRTVTLSSSNTASATVPASVVVTAGATTATFTVTSHVVAVSTTANISASKNGGTQSAPLTVTP